jgi:hypothetical protein
MYMLSLYNTYTENLFCQGYDSAPGLDIMLLKQQHFSVSGHAADPARQHPPVEYVYRRSHPLLQFPMVRALPRGGAAMFTRSTPGCGTLDGPSLAWAASQWPRLRRSEGSPGLRLPSADGQLSGLASDLRLVYVWYIHGIYLVYSWYILSDSKSCILSAIK